MHRLAALLTILALALPTAAIAAAPYCAQGTEPSFTFGFAQLKSLLGDTMGDPLECIHANPDNGDILQQTSTGLSFYRLSTNTATFTDGWSHWAWTAEGLVYWTGSDIDPPGTVVPATPDPGPTATHTPTATPVATVTPTPATSLRDNYSSAAISLFRDAAFTSSGKEYGLLRWDSPVVVSIGGSPTSDDITTVHANLQDITAATGHPIRVAGEGEASNVQVLFGLQRDFRLWLPGAVYTDITVGLARRWWTNFRMTQSTIVVDFTRSGWERNNLVIHEIAHAFGMLHADGDSDSVYFPFLTGKFERFRPLDLEVMKLLYDDRITPGMTLADFDSLVAG